jgi:acid stress-induced BolA-like protein IbaG/YrbA
MGEINMEELIKKALHQSIENCEVEVEGSESKYTVHIISNVFLGKSIIDRHKLVYSALNQYIKTGEIHALTIKSHTLDESK